MKKAILLLTISALCLNGCSWLRRSRSKKTKTPRPVGQNMTELPEGMTFEAKLNQTLDSGTRERRASREGDLFTATVVRGGAGVIPLGTTVKGKVTKIKHTINRTSMRLLFYELTLPNGRPVVITATPKSGSAIKFDELKEHGTEAAKGFLIEKGIDALTAGLLAPLWVAKKVVKGYDFVTKEERMVLPKGSTITIKLRTSAYVPRQ